MALGAIAGGLLSGGVSLISGLLGQSSAKKQAAKDKERIKAFNLQNQKEAARVNLKNEAWNKQVQARADAAAKVPIVTKNTGQDVTTNSGQDVSTVESSVNVQKMMKAAEESGFNPVTWLQNGGLQAFLTNTTTTKYGSKQTTKYGSTQTVTGSNAMDAALVGLSKPAYERHTWVDGNITQVPGTGEVVGNALQNGFNAWNQQTQQEAANNFQVELLNKQMQGLAKAAASAGYNSRTQAPSNVTGLSGFVPTAITSGTANKFGSGALSSNPRSGSGFKPGTSVRIGGVQSVPSRDWSDADDFTSRYGDSELMQTIYGIGVGVGDISSTVEERIGMPFGNPWEAGAAVRKGATSYLSPYVQRANEALTIKPTGRGRAGVSVAPAGRNPRTGQPVTSWW